MENVLIFADTFFANMTVDFFSVSNISQCIDTVTREKKNKGWSRPEQSSSRTHGPPMNSEENKNMFWPAANCIHCRSHTELG